MCFYHGCEGPFTFLAVSPTIGLTQRLFGAFFPAVCSLISFRNVCFSPCCESFLLLLLGIVVDGLKSVFPGLSCNS